MLRFTILASGSSGNCALVETNGARILVDAGLSAKQIALRMEPLGVSLGELDGIVITHEHHDHVCGLPVLAKRHGIPIHANHLTAEALRDEMPGFNGWQIFQTGASIAIGDVKVDTFSIPHDAYDPVGLLVRHALGNVGFVTDLGYATRLVLDRARTARALVLEANHDPALLQADTRRPWSIKQRILSRHGHLSNAAAADVAAQLTGSGPCHSECSEESGEGQEGSDLASSPVQSRDGVFPLEELFLGHLSADCNSPDLARAAVAARLNGASARVRIHDTYPDRPAQSVCWS